MSITQERFEQGLTYEDYKAQMTRSRERLEENERTVEITQDDLDFFRRLPRPLKVVVLAEDWCGDVIANLPVLGRLAAESGTLNLRVFLRDQNLDLMDQYLKDGEFRSIPVFAFFDPDFNELGCWIERPAAMSERMDRMRKDLWTQDPLFFGVAPGTPMAQLPDEARSRMAQANADFRAQNRAFSDHEVVREIRVIVARGLGMVDVPAAEAPGPATSARAVRPAKVSITYCAACGYEPQTLALTGALMREFTQDLASIELIPWHDGTFDVVVDGELVHSMLRDGGFPEHATIIRAVRERMSA